MNYYYTHGSGFPDKEKLFNINPDIVDKIKNVITKCLDAKELLPYLEQPRFSYWLNSTIRKAYRSYTNPTATDELFKHFNIHTLMNLYEEIRPVNEFLFSKYRDHVGIQNNFARFGLNKAEFFENNVYI